MTSLMDGIHQGTENELIQRNESGSTSQSQVDVHEESASSTSIDTEMLPEHAEEVPHVSPHWTDRRPFSTVKAFYNRRNFRLHALSLICRIIAWYYLITGIYHLLIYFWLVLEQTPRDFYWEKRSQQLATKDEMGLWEEALTALGNNDLEWFSLVALYIRREFGREPSAPRG